MQIYPYFLLFFALVLGVDLRRPVVYNYSIKVNCGDEW